MQNRQLIFGGRTSNWVAVTFAIFSGLGGTGAVRAQAKRGVDFGREVLPLLSENCFQCHGPDDENRKGKLRLDRREGAIAELGGHRAVVPGDPSSSVLMQRILSKDPDERMPPIDSDRVLSAEDIDILRRWIESG
ncbi:MAG: c-type cytochrome domain-containing protein, partial [Planctomycetota bacterium]